VFLILSKLREEESVSAIDAIVDMTDCMDGATTAGEIARQPQCTAPQATKWDENSLGPRQGML